MCTAATYKTKDFYFGRTLDYEISYGDQVVITPRNYVFDLREGGQLKNHYAIDVYKRQGFRICHDFSAGYYGGKGRERTASADGLSLIHI